MNHGQHEPVDTDAMQPTTPDPLTYAGRLQIAIDSAPMTVRDLAKRLIRDAGAWWLVSDSPDQRRYPRREAGPVVEVIGRVVYRQSERL